MNPEALEKGTHPRNHQVGGLPWARYSVDELNQAKAGDRPIFWAAPHDPDEDSSWTLPGLLGMFGHSYTLHQLPVQDVADSKEQMILRAVCDERISVLVESLQQFPEVYKALMDRIGGPGALAEVKVNWRCNTKQWWVGAVPDSVAPSIYRKLGYTNDMIKLMGLDPSAPGCRTGADGPDIRPKETRPVEMKHVFWAHMECGLVLSSVTAWELIPKTKGETRGGYMCKYCKGYWRAGGGGARLLQIRAGKAILQLVMDEPPEGLYNRWVKGPRPRCGTSPSWTRRCPGSDSAIWELILRNPEAAALKRIDDIAKGPRDDAGQRHLPAHHPGPRPSGTDAQRTPGGTAAEGADIPPQGTAQAQTCTRRGKLARLGLIRGAPWFPSLVWFSLFGAAP